uniref:Ciliary microtubule inner protein 2A-C-like domain-containing protein n=1 Tax=Calidris pygmaea TaxID=425635 RepID=A0A8C3KQP2_9CHAR
MEPPRESSIFPPHPCYIPGYEGYVPQFNYRFGETYGKTTYRLLTDPGVRKSPRSVLAPLHKQKFIEDFSETKHGVQAYLPGRPGEQTPGSCPFARTSSANEHGRTKTQERQVMPMKTIAHHQPTDAQPVPEHCPPCPHQPPPQFYCQAGHYPKDDARPGAALRPRGRSSQRLPPAPWGERLSKELLYVGFSISFAAKSQHVSWVTTKWFKMNPTLGGVCVFLFVFQFLQRNPVCSFGKRLPHTYWPNYRIYTSAGLIPSYTGFVPDLRHTYALTYGNGTRKVYQKQQKRRACAL